MTLATKRRFATTGITLSILASTFIPVAARADGSFVMNCSDAVSGSRALDSYADGTTSNGIMYFSACTNTGTNVTKATMEYKKTSGSGVTIRFYWRITDHAGSANYATYPDAGQFTMSPGQDKFYRWYYGAPLSLPTSRCAQGMMKDMISGATYYTHVQCLP